MSPRRIVSIPAVIVFDMARQRLPCIVRNISNGGAKLQIFALAQVPGTFDLFVEGKLVPCRLVWRALKEIGVSFDTKKH